MVLALLGAVLLGVAIFALLKPDLLEGWGAGLASRFRGGLSLPETFLIVFIAGILTSLTPCVYPVVPLAVTYLGARTAESRLKAFSLAAAYVLGMVACYTALGAAAGLTGTTFGAATQKWWIFALVATVVLAFALSMLGLFTITVPPALQGLIGKSKGPGYRGAVLMGATSGLVTAPCTAPVLGTLILPMISRQSVALGSTLLAVFGLGMGMLFLVVGTYSGVLSSLPRSGRWMQVVKVGLAVAILAVSGYFYYQAWRLFPYRGGARETGAAASAFGAGPHAGMTATPAGFSPTAGAIGERRPTPASAEERRPGRASARGAADERRPAPTFEIVDVKDRPQSLAAYRGKTLHILFFAVWCPPCLEQIRGIERADARFRGRGYRALLVGVKEREAHEDLKAFAEQRGLSFPVAWDGKGELARAFGVGSVPQHVIIGPDGRIVYEGKDAPDGFEKEGAGLLPR